MEARTYVLVAMSLYWFITAYDKGVIVHRPWLRIAIGAVFMLLGVISAGLDEARAREIERMRWDD